MRFSGLVTFIFSKIPLILLANVNIKKKLRNRSLKISTLVKDLKKAIAKFINLYGLFKRGSVQIIF